MKKKRDAALELAFEVIGGPAALAKILGISKQAVGNWRRCPAPHAMRVEQATGGRVSRNRLRPDVFNPPKSKRREERAA